jgi:hypothetical protein
VSHRVLLIEFNEITPSLVFRFMSDGMLPHFKRLYERSRVYLTDAGDAPLEPWIQWPSIHCGKTHDEHGVRYLGEGRHVSFPGIATILSQAGRRVGVFGTINTNYRDLNGYFIPDPWDQPEFVAPLDVLPFYSFVSKHIKENSRHATATVREIIAFLRFMVRNGLSLRTIWQTGCQLAREAFRPGQKWRRALILDLLQYDLFRRLNERFDVEFASFFSNSTAHLQHYYWRNMDPQRFSAAPPPGSDPSLRNAIQSAYVAMDGLLGRITADHPSACIFLCSGLSQKAWDETTKCTYRPHDFNKFLAFAGIQPTNVIPVMAERFRIECSTEADARAIADRLSMLTIDGTAFMGIDVRKRTINLGCDLYDSDDAIYAKVVRNWDGGTAVFRDLFYRVTTMNSGQHDPVGMLWVENGVHEVIPDKLPLTAIAPMILEKFGV